VRLSPSAASGQPFFYTPLTFVRQIQTIRAGHYEQSMGSAEGITKALIASPGLAVLRRTKRITGLEKQGVLDASGRER
jgi:hypothetical protein